MFKPLKQMFGLNHTPPVSYYTSKYTPPEIEVEPSALDGEH
jgi:hypothetical protein